MAKENNDSTPKLTTKKHLARLERENRQKKVLLISMITVLAVIILTIGYGILNDKVFKYNKPVAKVANTIITVEQFQKRVQYERLMSVENFYTYASSPYASFFQSYLVELQNSLDNYLQFGSDVLDSMIKEAVVAEKARELGISVSDADIEKELEKGFGFFPNGTPTTVPTIEYRPTSTFSPAQLAIITLTPTATLEPTATLVPPTPTLEGAVKEGTVTPTTVPLTSTPEVAPTATQILPTATPYTREGFEALYQDMIANISDQFSYSEIDFHAYAQSLLLNQKVFDHITKDVTVDQDMVWTRHILVATEEEALGILAKLDEGQDWAVLAVEFSSDTSNSSNGGDLGWIYKGQMVEPFEAQAYKLAIGEVSQPVKTDFGFHIIQVLGHEIRQLSESELSAFKNTVFAKFIDDAKVEITIEKKDLWASVVPTSPMIPAEYRVAAE